MAEQRVTQVATETLHTGGTTSARATQVAAEVLTPGVANLRVTQVAVEVLRTVALPSPRTQGMLMG